MSEIFRRLLGLFRTFGIVKQVHSVMFIGNIPSTNDIYQSRHWTVRHKLEEKFTKEFRNLFKKLKIPKVDQFGLIVFYNHALDVDNVSFVEKIFVDSFRREVKVFIPKYPGTKKPIKDPKTKKPIRFEDVIYEGHVANDTQNYFKFLSICPDKTLPENSVEFNVCVL